MGWENVAKCDECKVIKRDGNKWIAGRHSNELYSPITIKVCKIKDAETDFNLLFCGVPCLLKWLAEKLRFLEE